MSAQKKRRKEELVQELENERELVQRCQAGELAAYEILYRHFEQPLLRFGLRMLGRQEDAEDALQTTFLKLYRGVAKFNFDSKFSTYLFRIMMNVCFDALNKKKKMQTAELQEVEQSYAPGVDLRLQLEDAIERLPERMKACFVLFAVQGLKQTEVAAILDLNLGTVKAHIFQAKTQLRTILSDTKV